LLITRSTCGTTHIQGVAKIASNSCEPGLRRQCEVPVAASDADGYGQSREHNGRTADTKDRGASIVESMEIV
jgi:hypothetical protein